MSDEVMVELPAAQLWLAVAKRAGGHESFGEGSPVRGR